jgi:hypothetical protein
MAELKKAETNAAQIQMEGEAHAEFEEAKRMHDFFNDLGREKGPIDPVETIKPNQIDKIK